MLLDFIWKLLKIILFVFGTSATFYGIVSFFTTTYSPYAAIMAAGMAATIVSLFMTPTKAGK